MEVVHVSPAIIVSSLYTPTFEPPFSFPLFMFVYAWQSQHLRKKVVTASKLFFYFLVYLMVTTSVTWSRWCFLGFLAGLLFPLVSLLWLILTLSTHPPSLICKPQLFKTPLHPSRAKTCRLCRPVGAIFSGQCFLGKAREKHAKTGEKQALFWC